jgi:hypothetical protein
MCSVCMASAAVVAGSVVSTGGVTALLVKVLGRKKKDEKTNSNAKEQR